MSKLLIIGGGTIGEILLQGAVQLGIPCTVSEPNPDRATTLQNTYDITVVPNVEVISDDTIVALAVKPQSINEVATTLSPLMRNQLIISVMAGISTTTLHKLFTTQRIVRTMPNTPAALGQGMTTWTATSHVSDEDVVFVTALLDTFGKHIPLDSDDMIDKATAISGSGPAYLFRVAEELVLAAKELGFDSNTATTLVNQTLLGASKLLDDSPLDAATLRTNVTSKGGTTAAAMQSLNDANSAAIWQAAVQAAYNRAKELSSNG